jgi:hypothetical protein
MVSNVDSQRNALQKLIEEDSELRKLSEYEEKINIFTIIKNGATEIRHSNILAWLLQVREHHGLGESFLREFIKAVIRNNPDKASILDWAFLDYSAQIVQTEDKNIDITIKFENTKHVIAIENKTKSSEHKAGNSENKQTTEYRRRIEDDCDGYEKLFVYLTPDGDLPADEDWCILSYQDILTIIEDLLKSNSLLPEVALILSNYCSLIKSDVIGRDNKLFAACNNVYKRHRLALDLLLDYSSNKTKVKQIDPANAELCGRVYSLYENEIELIRKNQVDEVAELALKLANYIDKEDGLSLSESAGKTYIFFTSQELDQYLPRLKTNEGSWGTKNSYHFWFYTGQYRSKKTLRFALELGGLGLSEEDKTTRAKIISKLKPNDKRPEYRYKIIKSKAIPMPKKAEGETLTEEEISTIFKKGLQSVKDWTKDCIKALNDE